MHFIKKTKCKRN